MVATECGQPVQPSSRHTSRYDSLSAPKLLTDGLTAVFTDGLTVCWSELCEHNVDESA